MTNSPPQPQTPDDGGSAFPHQVEYIAGDQSFGGRVQYGGMSLRDWFAGQILSSYWWRSTDPKTAGDDPLRYIATETYKMADAMLAARKERTP